MTAVVYRPRKDSFLLKEAVEQRDLDGKRVLDMGTGSGIIAAAAARHGAAVTAADIDPAAVAAARERAADEDVDITAVRSDLFEVVDGDYDIIAFNPPYVPADGGDVDGEARSWAGGEDGRAVTDRFIEAAPAHLAPGGTVLLLQSTRNDLDRTLSRFEDAGLDAAVEAEEELHFERLVVIAASR
ncbi:MAG: HemK2/MTQ2 family protein methyltransferase [Candidatus Nanohaloarchaea archaeon]|nr:HemK2/MTQ2 family protein methyltransferase [Candidatus Nanohaloarchaea archaeon]